MNTFQMKSIKLLIVSLLSYISIFSSQLKWSRLLNTFGTEIQIQSWQIDQVRFIFTLLLTTILFQSIRTNKEKIISFFLERKSNLYILTLIIGLNFYLATFSFDKSNSEYEQRIIFDIFFSILIFINFLVSYAIFDRKFIEYLFYISVFAALALGCLSVGYPLDESQRPLASTYTAYRIAIFGAFSAIYLIWNSEKPLIISILWGGAAILCLFLSYATLSKAAVASGVLSLAILSFIYLSLKKYKAALACITLNALSFVIFISLSGASFINRIEVGLVKPVVPVDEMIKTEIEKQREKEGVDKKAVSTELHTIDTPSTQWIEDFVSYFNCRSKSTYCETPENYSAKIISDNLLLHHVYISDYSFRIRLLLSGLSGFLEEPIFGQGFGKFEAKTVNRYDGTIETYYYPHNIVVELLYSSGIVGTLLFFAVFVISALIYIRKEPATDSIPVLALFCALFIGALFGGDYTDFKLNWICLLILILLGQTPFTEEGPQTIRSARKRTGLKDRVF